MAGENELPMRLNPQCTRVRGILERLEGAKKMPECQRPEYQEFWMDEITRLNEVAIEFGPHLDEIPAVDEEVPPFGTPERCEFEEMCPVFRAIKEAKRSRTVI